MTRASAVFLGVVLSGTPLAAQDAQAIARRVAAAPDGEVRLAYAARPGVVGDGWSVIAWDCEGTRCRHYQRRNWGGRDNDWRWVGEPGPVRVSLRRSGGTVTSVRVYVGGTWPPGERVTDLGTLPAAAAARYLLELARTDSGRPARDAVFAAVLADSAVVWRELLAIGRNRNVHRDTRKQAVFWLGQEAEAAALQGLDSLVSADDETIEVREAAVFALSQRPPDEGIPLLLRVARANPDHRLRRRAMFWLAQSGDPRALALFEEILTRK